MKKLILAACAALAVAVSFPASAQWPSWEEWFRSGFFTQLGRDAERLLLGGVQYALLPYSGSAYPGFYSPPAGCPRGFVCVRHDTYVALAPALPQFRGDGVYLVDPAGRYHWAPNHPAAEQFVRGESRTRREQPAPRVEVRRVETPAPTLTSQQAADHAQKNREQLKLKSACTAPTETYSYVRSSDGARVQGWGC